MRRAFAAVAVALGASTGSFGAAAGVAHAAEPYDSQLRDALAVPGDPAFVEITAANDPAHSGPLDTARLAAMGVTLPASVATVVRGGAVRGFSDATHRLVELGYDLADGAHAKSALDAAKTMGAAFDVPGIPGAVGRATSGATPTAVVAFTMTNRAFLIVLAGADAGHGLLLDQALQVANTAAESLAANLTTSAAGDSSGAIASAEGSVPAAASGGIRGALRRDDVRLGLAALAGLLLWLLLRSSKRRAAPSTRPVATMRRSAASSWQHNSWLADGQGWRPPGAPMSPPAAAAEPYEWPAATSSWGVPALDSFAAPGPPPQADDAFSFPGAERWPDDVTPVDEP